jgi:hypothetical protein
MNVKYSMTLIPIVNTTLMRSSSESPKSSRLPSSSMVAMRMSMLLTKLTKLRFARESSRSHSTKTGQNLLQAT